MKYNPAEAKEHGHPLPGVVDPRYVGTMAVRGKEREEEEAAADAKKAKK